jgi:hypothetical protein
MAGRDRAVAQRWFDDDAVADVGIEDLLWPGFELTI